MNDAAVETRGRFSGSLSRAGLMLLSGIVGGALAALLISRFGSSFHLSAEAERAVVQAAASGAPPAPEVVKEIDRVRLGNLVLSTGLVGAALGGMLSCAAGAIGVGLRRGAGGLAVGLVLGGLFGALGGLLAVTVRDHLDGRVSETAQVLLMHLSAWVCIGAGIGLSMVTAGQSIRKWMVCLRVAIIGGVLAVVLQQLIFMVVFPLESSKPLVPQIGPAGIAWAMVGGAAIGLMLGSALASRAKQPAAEAASEP